MQKKQKLITIAPFRLLQDTYTDNSSNEETRTVVADNEVSKQSTTKSVTAPTVVNSTFAERYVDEIAPTAKMKVYRNIAATHKESLLKEARIMQVRFSDDAQESARMEREVGRISQMLTQFVGLLEAQSEVVSDINESAKLATRSVTQAGTQLQQTIARTESGQWSMVLLVVGLSVLIVLLDAMTP